MVMTQAEYKREPRTSGRQKSMALTAMVLFLCLASFALGVMVGGSGSETSDVKNKSASATSADVPTTVPAIAPATVRVSPVVQPGEMAVPETETQEDGTPSETDSVTEAKAVMPAEDVDALKKEATATRVAAAVEAPLLEKSVTRETPLGSGINLRKKTDTSITFAEKENLDTSTSDIKEVTAPAVQDSPTKATVAKRASTSSKTAATAAKRGGYVVQVAAFRRDTDAQHLAQKLKADFPVYVRQVDLADKGQWFRVLVGPASERSEADMLKQKVKNKAGVEGFVKKYTAN